ncbi:Malate dehydrogenase [Aquicella siphonis]|uniref:Malate dehydrogenase n=1 Tax=Aquicella siphonis TaxID=254247 RepID=A0A5E4PKC2_9COXI|nr:malate dehydrogenase [Aquicella siphonis]VVC76732.1 Malate dehydrogenase [Aquicella siphonis]
MSKRVKVAISGAAGQIGYALIFRVASGQMFGPETEVELNLLEVPPVLPSLQGVQMELEDCAFPLLKKVTTTADVNEAMKDVNWAVLVGSMPRKDGMERSDLLNINGKIFTSQGRAINDHAAADVRVFVVGNPCNTNCLVAMNNAPDVPRDRFYAMTMLDEFRARTQLAIKAGVDVTAVTQMAIWGNHSSTQYPDFYHAKINDKPAPEVITDLNWLQNDFIPMIQKRGAAVIKARGASSAASAANAALMSVYHLTHDTVQGETFSVARCSQGEYDIDEGLIFSVPCRTEGGKLKVITGLAQNDFGQEKIRITLDELRKERDAVKELGLI